MGRTRFQSDVQRCVRLHCFAPCGIQHGLNLGVRFARRWCQPLPIILPCLTSTAPTIGLGEVVAVTAAQPGPQCHDGHSA